jgi:hypothetical protein
VTIPLHSININVKGDKICKPTPTQETQDENENFESQGNPNDPQNQPIPNVPGVHNPSVVDLFQENTKFLSSNSRQPLVVNLLISFTTPTHGNPIIKRIKIMFFLLSLILQIETTIFLWRQWRRSMLCNLLDITILSRNTINTSKHKTRR